MYCKYLLIIIILYIQALLHSYFRKHPRPTPPDQLPKQQKTQENTIQQKELNSKPPIQNRGEVTEHRNKRKAQEIGNKGEKRIHLS
jgi:hypothetical protein